MKQFFRMKYQWQSVYHHYQKWCKDGSWERVWQYLLNKYKFLIDMSNIQLDGTHTPVKRGGQAVAYQGRKKSKTSNMLIFTDSRGTPLVCSDPVEGNHNDDLVPTVRKMIGQYSILWDRNGLICLLLARYKISNYSSCASVSSPENSTF
jgi:hypothetical protein